MGFNSGFKGLTFICIQLKNKNCTNYSTASRDEQRQVLCYVIINASMAQCLTANVHRYSGSSDISCFCGTHQRKPTTGCLTSATSKVLPFYRIHVIRFDCYISPIQPPYALFQWYLLNNACLSTTWCMC